MVELAWDGCLILEPRFWTSEKINETKSQLCYCGSPECELLEWETGVERILVSVCERIAWWLAFIYNFDYRWIIWVDEYGMSKLFVPPKDGCYDDGIHFVKCGWENVWLLNKIAKLGWPFRSGPTAIVVAAKADGRSFVCVQLNVFWLCDVVIINEWYAIPRRQKLLPETHFHFTSFVQSDFVVERGDCCSFWNDCCAVKCIVFFQEAEMLDRR